MCHTLARENGGTVTEADVNTVARNFYCAKLSRYDKPIFILQNIRYSYAAFATSKTRKNWSKSVIGTRKRLVRLYLTLGTEIDENSAAPGYSWGGIAISCRCSSGRMEAMRSIVHDRKLFQ